VAVAAAAEIDNRTAAKMSWLGWHFSPLLATCSCLCSFIHCMR